MPERSRRVRKVSPACARRSATHPQSRTLRPASPAPSSPHSASLGGHCSGCSLSTFSPAAAGAAAAASSAGFAAASVAAAAARVRSWGAGPEREAEAEVVESGRMRRRCKADGLGFRRERRERGEARSREAAIANGEMGIGDGADARKWGSGLALSAARILQNTTYGMTMEGTSPVSSEGVF